MQTKTLTPQIPEKPAERRAWIKFQLELRGTTFTGLAAELGVTLQAVSNTAFGRPNNRVEARLAQEIGVPQAALFSEHFDSNGQRIRALSARRRHVTPSTPTHNVEFPEAC
ncbi:helix-turn-helix domain-containing protein [Methylobrevis pamukkalensis]|nr:helix-turn-helix domain-containing protein [Methylobrevis pamukkalensis]